MAQELTQQLNYGRMMQRAMQGLVAEVLGLVAQEGLPGAHHFYITVTTSHPGVILPDWLREKYPDEITIVLHHEFRDLAVTSEAFSVTLSFSGRAATLSAPFDAIRQFADPSAEFGLVFDPTDGEDEGEAEDAADADAPVEDGPSTDADGGAKTGEVVRLDAFRKK